MYEYGVCGVSVQLCVSGCLCLCLPTYRYQRRALGALSIILQHPPFRLGVLMNLELGF